MSFQIKVLGILKCSFYGWGLFVYGLYGNPELAGLTIALTQFYTYLFISCINPMIHYYINFRLQTQKLQYGKIAVFQIQHVLL